MRKAHWLGWGIVALFGLYLGYVALAAGRSDAERAFHFKEFGSLPVVENGRVKPFDTVARSRLLIINHRQTFKDAEGNTQPATRWLLDVLQTHLTKGGGPGLEHKIFRIENEEVLAFLRLDARSGLRYSLNEIRGPVPKNPDDGDQIDKLATEAMRISKIEPKSRTLFEAKLLELAQHLEQYVKLAKMETPGIIPAEGGHWLSVAEALKTAQMTKEEPHPLAVHFVQMLHAYGSGNADEFNEAVKLYRTAFEKNLPAETNLVRTEVYFNEFAPFYHAAVLYVFIVVLACLSWMFWFPTLNRAAFWSMLLVFLVHSWAMVIRMYLQGRPPVTNLYSSAIFIGWGCVLTCLVVEMFFRTSIALAVGAVTGSLSLFIAHFLSLDTGDTMEMMQAVLDTNFWLATHVTCITLGYTATFVAGFMGIVYVMAMVTSALLGRAAAPERGSLTTTGARGFFTNFFGSDAASVMGKMIYGVLCFAMFLSFTGTVLGGIWADQSWGRFWGWDPKENGALLIVLWVALILHARWGGMIKHRGMAVLAILGNCVTAWSWFGTNLLGVGLHAYGFMDGAMTGLIGFVLSQVAIAGIGLLPWHHWATTPKPQPAPQSA